MKLVAECKVKVVIVTDFPNIRSTKLTPTQNLGLWKSIVLPHSLQNLRYIHSDTDIKKMQTISRLLCSLLIVATP